MAIVNKGPFDRKRYHDSWGRCGNFDVLKRLIAFQEEALRDRLLLLRAHFTPCLIHCARPLEKLSAYFCENKLQSPIVYGHASQQMAPDVCFDEMNFPFKDNTFNSVISVNELHWVNAVPEAFANIHRTLKPNGLFLSAFIGEESLRSLRSLMLELDDEFFGGVNLRFSPFLTAEQAYRLLYQAGFDDVVTDRLSVKINYPSLYDLFDDLRKTNNRNKLMGIPARSLCRPYLRKLSNRYADFFKNEIDVDFVFLTAWKPAIL